MLIPLPTQPIQVELTPPLIRHRGSIDFPAAASYPIRTQQPPPDVTATAVYIIDTQSMVPLWSKNPDQPLPPASTTKIMTATIAMEAWSQENIVEPKNSPAIGKTINLKVNEQFTLADMIYGLLLESGNDVALALAQNYPGGYQAMVEAMNRKSAQFGMNNTRFVNVSGIDQAGHVSTAHDLAILAAEAMKNPQFREIVGTKEKEIMSIDGQGHYKLHNTNQLLGELEGVIGVKTGWTETAGESLVTYVDRSGKQIAIALLGSQDRFGETIQLVNWVYENHHWETPDIQTP